MKRSLLILGSAFLIAGAIQIVYGWSATCHTSWNGSGWDDGFDAVADVDPGGDATIMVSAPSCNYTCDAESRFAQAFRTPAWPQGTVKCPAGSGGYTASCCQRTTFTAIRENNYYVESRCDCNYSACGPVTGHIQNGIVNCNQN